MPDIALYTQTFPKDDDGKFTTSDIEKIIAASDPDKKLIFFISSLHFGRNEDGTPYLHLNDTDVNELDYFFRALIPLWSGVEFRVMLGGAGGAYNALYTDYKPFMNLLLQFLKKYPFLSGIDLDIEEELDPDPNVALQRAQEIIRDISTGSTKDFAITLAPVAGCLESGSVGMGGFDYTKLKKSPEWGKVEALNVQAYGSYSLDVFKTIIDSGFSASEIRMGMLGDQYGSSDALEEALRQLATISRRYPKLCGAILWETGDTQIAPDLWADAVARSLGGTGSSAKARPCWLCGVPSKNNDTSTGFFSREVGWNGN